MAGRFGSGMDFLAAQNEALNQGGRRGSGFWKLWLRDGETAQFYFLTDGAEMLVPLIHLKTIRPPGRKPFTIEVLCSKMSAEDEAECQLCDAAPATGDDGQPTAAFPGPFPRTVAYVYVEAIFHKTKDQKGEWESVKTAAGTVYREQVSEVRLLVAKFKLQDAIREAFVGDVTDPDYDPANATLCDRAYRLVRTGDRGRSQEQLIPSSKAGVPEHVTQAAAELPPLEETVVAEFDDTFQPQTVAKGNRPATEAADPGPADDLAGSEPDDGEPVDLSDLDF